MSSIYTLTHKSDMLLNKNNQIKHFEGGKKEIKFLSFIQFRWQFYKMTEVKKNSQVSMRISFSLAKA